MITRREAFAAIGAAVALGGARAGQGSRDAAGDSLSADLARVGSRAYSEEGIPMFLACENVGAMGTSPERPAGAPAALNRKVATAFQRYADEWQRIHPNAPAGDVAKIVELLADRDFARGGTESSL